MAFLSVGLAYIETAITNHLRHDCFQRVALVTLWKLIPTSATHDCTSRFFAPKIAIDEDPVTGSVHCMIAPYWAGRLGKDAISAYQASSRGGEMICELHGDRVVLLGQAALFSVGELAL